MVVKFNKSTLSNGVRVVTEHHPSSRSLCIGVWVMTGTRDEPKGWEGITHFLEHLVFKGTKTRSAFDIVRSLEELGGEINAFTTREYTCFHATVLAEDWKIALEVLSDLVTNMKLVKKDFELERSVVLQEIDMSDDDHEELAYDHFLSQFVGKHPLGRPILGTEKSLNSMSTRDVNEYYRDRYTGHRLIVSAAGNLDHEQIAKVSEKLLGKTRKRKSKLKLDKPKSKAFVSALDKTAEQLHVVMGFPSTSFQDPHRFEAFLANNLLGGGMTSYLYQAVRERKGLAYSVYSMLQSFIDWGILNISASTDPNRMDQVVRSIFAVIDKVRARGIRESELRLFRRQLEGNLLLGAEDIENRMNSLGVNEMVFGEYRPVEQVIQEVQKVTVKSLKRYMEEHLDPSQMGLLFLGSEATAAKDWFMKQPIAKPLRNAEKEIIQ